MSHQHFRPAFRLIVLSAGIVAAAGQAVAQSQAEEPYPAASSANSRAALRRAQLPDSRDAAVPASDSTDATHAGHHKSWKELAREHNEEKSRGVPSSGATPSPNEQKSHETHGRGTSLSPLTAASALAVVICLILILARLFRRHAPIFSQALPTEALEVLGRRFLDQRQSIILLRLGSRILVVGSSASGLQGLGEVNDPIEVDLIAGICRANKRGPGLGSPFLNLLKGQASPQTKPRHQSDPARRSQPRAPAPSIADEPPSARLADPEQELLRRLRGTPAGGAPHSGVAEVFRD
ncbi:MAG TPA: flagellar biosynthetic protein FliO [Planctomycetaceae bacterium]|nr:flagellar biosynthetic protein FliO [Planctomycetaceae bacterium]